MNKAASCSKRASPSPIPPASTCVASSPAERRRHRRQLHLRRARQIGDGVRIGANCILRDATIGARTE
jgi:hypothetical protein